MKILVISDTHGMTGLAEKVISDFENEIDGFIHLGDHIDDAVKLRKKFPKLKFWAVSGNCDFDLDKRVTYMLGSVCGHKIYMCHGHLEGVKYDSLRLVYKALDNDCEAALYGHTHCPEISREDGVLILNPGSLALPRGSTVKTFGMLEAEPDSLRGCIYGVYGDEYRIILRG